MSARRLSSVLLFAALSGPAPFAQAGPPIKDLLAYFPEGTNAVMRVQVADIVKSPRGLREKWGQRQNVEYLAGSIPLHPNIERIVVGTNFQPHRREPGWSISLIPTAKEVSLDSLAARMQGKIEEMGDDKIITTRQFGYFAQLTPEVLGNVGPVLVRRRGRVLDDTPGERVRGQALNLVVELVYPDECLIAAVALGAVVPTPQRGLVNLEPALPQGRQGLHRRAVLRPARAKLALELVPVHEPQDPLPHLVELGLRLVFA